MGKLETVRAEGPPLTGEPLPDRHLTATHFYASETSWTPWAATGGSAFSTKQWSRSKKMSKTKADGDTDDICSQETPRGLIAPLVGCQSLLKCMMAGYLVTVVLDTGAGVSLLDNAWLNKYLPGQQVRPLKAVTGESVPYDGWVEVVVNLEGNNDPDLSIRVPFLVSRLKIGRPIVGFNVIHKFIKDNGGNYKLIELIGRAMGIDTAAVSTLVSFIQTQRRPVNESATEKVGFKGGTVYPSQVAYIKCRVPEKYQLYRVTCAV